jgi:ABC-2 type transport system ATP-binding protein
MSSQDNYAATTHSLSRAFRGTQALSEVNLSVPYGSVFGLVGLNGAGKTTLIRHLIGSMRALHGSVTVLGQDPTIKPEKLLSRIGYMTEEDSLPQWMRVSDLIRFCRSVYPTWSDAYAAELCEMFALSTNAKLKSLSKGGRARAALLAAIAHRPELLILDEPSSGLDPIARADILEAIIRTVADEGRTVLFSSHLLEEIDRVCDHVAVMHNGRILESIPAVSLTERYVECFYGADAPSTRPPSIPGSFGPSGDGAEWSVLVDREH